MQADADGNRNAVPDAVHVKHFDRTGEGGGCLVVVVTHDPAVGGTGSSHGRVGGGGIHEDQLIDQFEISSVGRLSAGVPGRWNRRFIISDSRDGGCCDDGD